MPWDFDDDFWDLDPEDFALFGGVAGLLEEEMEKDEMEEDELLREEMLDELEEELDENGFD